jgi:phospholipase C
MAIKRKLAVFTALAALACAAGAAAPAVTHAQVTPIQHVVVLYLENHSFDNVLGYWCDLRRHRCPDGGMPRSVTLSDGSVVTPGVTPDQVPVVDHSVHGQLAAIDGGKMDGWGNVGGCHASTGYACMSGYLPGQIPNLTTLAQRFAVSDHTFSMGDSPSWGGHLYVAMASQDGFVGDIPAIDTRPGAPPQGPGWGCDSNRVAVWRDPGGTTHWVPSCVPDPALGLPNGGAFEPTPVHYAPTIFDRLDAAGLPWRIYGMPYPVHWQPGIKSTYVWSICPSLAECLYTRQDANLVKSSQFVTDALAGHLPAYSVVVPGAGTAGDSQHNGHSMTAGDNWIGSVASAVMNGPAWSSTVLFITYDDCGCFYDQVPPGTNPDGTQQGPRTPLVIVSPYTRPGYTDTTATTFAGILAYVEHTFGLRPLGANDARAYAFAGAFNYAQLPLRPVRMVTRPVPLWAKHIHLTPAMINDPT